MQIKYSSKINDAEVIYIYIYIFDSHSKLILYILWKINQGCNCNLQINYGYVKRSIIAKLLCMSGQVQVTEKEFQ